MNLKNLFWCFTLGLVSCNEPQSKPLDKYVDLKGYFLKEALRLQKLNKTVLKTVAHNGHSESKIISSIKWVKELSLFIESDINKIAWEKRYRITNSSQSVRYDALNSDLKTQRIVINYGANHSINSVEIINKTQNFLFDSEEKLKYFPDSIYQINKSQHVLLVGDNQYDIKGTFSK